MLLKENFNSNLFKEEETQKRIPHLSDGRNFVCKLAILTTADNFSNKSQLQGQTQISQISQLQKRIYLQPNRARIISCFFKAKFKILGLVKHIKGKCFGER